MGKRLNQARQAELEPKRLQVAVDEITKLGLTILSTDNSKVVFRFKGETIMFFPYSGWHSGKNITDGRGLQKLLNQLK